MEVIMTALGSISGLEIMEILKENNIVTRHPLELIIFSDEEGSLLGSKALGAFNKERLKMLSQSGLTVRHRCNRRKVDSISSVMRKR
jgi:N-carbamoyl-L-amino-acid hydrolase